jgi:hypothetical protein
MNATAVRPPEQQPLRICPTCSSNLCEHLYCRVCGACPECGDPAGTTATLRPPRQDVTAPAKGAKKPYQYAWSAFAVRFDLGHDCLLDVGVRASCPGGAIKSARTKLNQVLPTLKDARCYQVRVFDGLTFVIAMEAKGQESL